MRERLAAHRIAASLGFSLMLEKSWAVGVYPDGRTIRIRHFPDSRISWIQVLKDVTALRDALPWWRRLWL